jgi:hypothetical protein
MSTFYLLPPRPLVGEHFRPLFPDLAWTGAARAELADALAAVVGRQADVFVIYREELPDGEEPARALADGFGAEAGDEVIEVRAGSRPGEWTARRWRLQEAA